MNKATSFIINLCPCRIRHQNVFRVPLHTGRATATKCRRTSWTRAKAVNEPPGASAKQGVSTALFLRNPTKVLLILRRKAPNKGLWSLPGGRVNNDETLFRAAQRELQEETGLDGRQMEMLPQPVARVRVGVGECAWRISVFAGICRTEVVPIAGDDALEAKFWETNCISKLDMVVDNLEQTIFTALTRLREEELGRRYLQNDKSESL